MEQVLPGIETPEKEKPKKVKAPKAPKPKEAKAAAKAPKAEEVRANLTMTKDQHRAVRMYAAEFDLTMNEAMRALIAAGLKAKKGGKP